MATFGLDFYGQQVYGAPGLLHYDASPFQAKPYSYGVIDVTWFIPTTLTPDTSLFRLVRNQFGYPEGVRDGTILIGTEEDPVLLKSAPLRYIDIGLKPASYQYYSIFVTDTATGAWFRAGNATGLSVKDWGYSANLYDWLPTPYKVADIFDGTNTSINQDLVNFLDIFGFQASQIRTEISLISGPYDIDNVNISLLPAILGQLGIGFENAITFAQARQMARYAAYIYKWKGTKVSAKKYAEALTGWGIKLLDGKNLLLDRNDASGEESIGRWYGAQRFMVSRVTNPPAYLEVASPSGFPNRTAGIIKLTVGIANSIHRTWGSSVAKWGDPLISWTGVDLSALPPCIAQLPQPSTIKNCGVPIKEATPYTASAYLCRQTGGTARDATITVTWYDGLGAVISSVTSSPLALTVGWGSRLTVSGTAPTHAQWAGISLNVLLATDTEVFYLDAVQVEKAPSATSYEDPRVLNVVLQPTKENLIETPIFTVGLGDWYTGNISLPLADISTTTEVGSFIPALTHALKFTEDSAVPQIGVIQANFDGQIRANTAITFSAYVKSIGSTSGKMRLQFDGDPDTYETVYTPTDGSLLTTKALTSNIATLTTLVDHMFSVGDKVFVRGVDSIFDTTDGTEDVILTITADTFTYARTHANVTLAATSGHATVWTRAYVSAMSPPQTMISTGAISGNTVTITTIGDHAYAAGQEVTISNAGIPFDGTFPLLTASGDTFTYFKVYDTIPTVSIANGLVEGLRKWTATIELLGGIGLTGYADAVMLEPLSDMFINVPNTPELAPGPFFHGNTNLGDTSDTAYLGTPQDSISVFYPNKVVKYYRLRETLGKYLPSGCDFKLTFASRFGS